MLGRRIVPGIISLGLMALLALPILTFPGFQARHGQTVYIVAARDSHLFTMCPDAGEVKMPDGRTWKSNNNVMVNVSANVQSFSFLDTFPPTSVSLPVPALSLPSGQSGGQTSSDRVVLDRVASDAEIERRVELEFLSLKQYTPVDSAEKADLVFLVEGIYSPEEIWSGRVFMPYFLGDRKGTFLQAALAIVVPVDVYIRNAGNSAALVAARLWEGSVIYQWPVRRSYPNGVPPKAEEITPQAASL